jgi:transposase
MPTIAENKRAPHKAKRGPQRWFDTTVYTWRLSSERTFAWLDKFRALLVRVDRCAAHFMGAPFIVYALINLRHHFAKQKFQ